VTVIPCPARPWQPLVCRASVPGAVVSRPLQSHQVRLLGYAVKCRALGEGCSGMAGTFPHETALSQMARAVLAEQRDQRQGRRRSFRADTIALPERKVVDKKCPTHSQNRGHSFVRITI
jgi:hypothetical protein